MFNMATMAADECREDAQVLSFRKWADRAGRLLGHYVADGSDDESDLFDLYADGCTPSEAVIELRAQQATLSA
jgi:hypothetical protein